jgi:glycosyltransferase involved in cell wall biosynthesis
LIILQENGGQASAFNRGFEKCTGDLVVFLDSDDLLDPNAVERVVASWKTNYSKMQYPLRIIGSDDMPNGLQMPSCQLSEGDVRDELLTTGYYMTSPTSGNVYSREFLSRLMPMPTQEWAQGNDSYINTFAGFMGEIGAIQEPLGSYRVHESNMSGVAAHNEVNLKQVDKLISHGLRQQDLIEKIARDLDIPVKPKVLEKHWLHLKLMIARDKLGAEGGTKALFLDVIRFIASVARTKQLRMLRKIKLTSWAVSVAVLPQPMAKAVISYAFEKAPNSKFLRLLRLS